MARYPRSSRGPAFVLCALALVAWAPSALGQSDEPSSDREIDKARTLFREARVLVAERQYSEACRKFEQSLAIERGIGTMYNLADCWEKLGKTASAHAMFLSTATAARSLSQPDRARLAKERAAALEPKLSRLLVTVGTPSEGITVWRGKKQIDQAVWGTPTPIDPGIYEIRATAPGKQPWTARVEIPEIATTATTISVTVPPLAPESKKVAAAVTPPPPPKAATESAPREQKPLSPPETPPAADASSGSSSRIIALSVGAAGVGALVAGVALALDYKSKNDEASDICPTTVDCSRAEIDRHAQLTDDARSSRNWAYLAFGVGGAAILGAGAIYVTSPGATNPSSRSSSGARHGARIAVSPLAGAKGPLGAVVHGSW